MTTLNLAATVRPSAAPRRPSLFATLIDILDETSRLRASLEKQHPNLRFSDS